MKVIFSIDDGDRLDLELAQLFKKRRIPAIFFIPSNCSLRDDEIKKIANMGFTIGGHTVSHPEDMKRLSKDSLTCEIEVNREWLIDLTGQKVEYFCYPGGRYNEDTIKAIRRAGFKTARTTLVGNYKEPTNLYKIETSVHIYPNRKEYDGVNWLDYAYNILDKAANEPNGYFHVWGHSDDIKRFGLLEDVVKLLERIKVYDYRKGKY